MRLTKRFFLVTDTEHETAWICIEKVPVQEIVSWELHCEQTQQRQKESEQLPKITIRNSNLKKKK